MKTTFLKIGMPIMVFMLAIVFAFATEKAPSNNESLLVQGYIEKDDTCQLSRECDNTGGPVCQTLEGDIVYRINNGTFCSEPMTNWF
jgi:hypothetical protein